MVVDFNLEIMYMYLGDDESILNNNINNMKR